MRARVWIPVAGKKKTRANARDPARRRASTTTRLTLERPRLGARVHEEAIEIFNPAASAGDEFAVCERLAHLRALCAGGGSDGRGAGYRGRYVMALLTAPGAGEPELVEAAGALDRCKATFTSQFARERRESPCAHTQKSETHRNRTHTYALRGQRPR